ncbi:MAG: hypothetical protein ACE5J5_08225 [Candidatus Hydrothermarchaeales archaeon]
MSDAEEGQKSDIQESLNIIEKQVNTGNYNLKELGFWKIVSKVKKDTSLIEKHGDQIGRIDQKVFREKALLPVDTKIGHLLETIGTFFGFAFIIYAYQNPGTIMGITFVIACLILMTTLHPLSHYVVGRNCGIKFTFYFLDGPAMIEPTLKTDYTSYLKTSPKSRAIMHATGPIVATLIPLAIGLLAYVWGAPNWSYLILILIFLANIPFEIMPVLVAKTGLKGIIAEKSRKTDSYRALREWRIHKGQKSR